MSTKLCQFLNKNKELQQDIDYLQIITLIKSLDRISQIQLANYHKKITDEIHSIEKDIEKIQNKINELEAQDRKQQDNEIQNRIGNLYKKLQNMKSKKIELQRQQNKNPQKFLVRSQKLLYQLQYEFNISLEILKEIDIDKFVCFTDIQKKKLINLIQIVLIFHSINVLYPNNTNTITFLSSIPQDAIADIDTEKYKKLLREVYNLFQNSRPTEVQLRAKIQQETVDWASRYEIQILQEFTETIVRMNRDQQNIEEIRRWLSNDEQQSLKNRQSILQGLSWINDVKLQTIPFKLLYQFPDQQEQRLVFRDACTVNFHSTSFQYLMEMLCKSYNKIVFIESSKQSLFRTQLNLICRRQNDIQILIKDIQPDSSIQGPKIQLNTQASDLSKFQPIFSLQNYLNFFKLINNKNLESEDIILGIFQSFASLQYAVKTLYLQPNKNQFFSNKLIIVLAKDTLNDVFKAIDRGKGAIVFSYMNQRELPILIGSGIVKNVILCGLPAKGIASFAIEDDLFNSYMTNGSYAFNLDRVYQRQKEQITGNIIKIINLMSLNGKIQEKTLIIADKRLYIVNGQVFICENENNIQDKECENLKRAQQNLDYIRKNSINNENNQQFQNEVWEGITVYLDNSQQNIKNQ